MVSTVAGGDPEDLNFVDGPIAQARFRVLKGIALDEHDGSLYVSEDFRIRKILHGMWTH